MVIFNDVPKWKKNDDIPGEVVPCSDWSSSPVEVLAKGLQHLAERQKVGGFMGSSFHPVVENRMFHNFKEQDATFI